MHTKKRKMPFDRRLRIYCKQLNWELGKKISLFHRHHNIPSPPLYVFVIVDGMAFLFLCRSEDFRQALIAWAITQSNSGKFSFFRFFASPADVMFSRLSPKGGLCRARRITTSREEER